MSSSPSEPKDDATASAKKSLSVEEYQSAKDNLLKTFAPMIRSWKSGEAGELRSWMAMLQSIMSSIQQTHRIPGTQKAQLALDALQGVARILMDENVAGLSDTELETVRVVLSSEGLQLLTASTSFLKNLIQRIDTDGDGDISAQECRDFCCGCFGGLKKKA